MKKLLLISLLAFVSLSAYSKADDTITIPLSEADPPVYQEPPRKGKHTSSKRETCLIDFTTRSITPTVAAQIISYKLRNATGEYVVTVTSDDRDMVEFLSTTSGSYLLHLVTEVSVYIGSISL